MKLKSVFTIAGVLAIVFMGGCVKDDDPGGNPSVTLTDPLSNVTGVSRNKAVAFTFSEEMDPLTLNASTFTLKQGTTTVPGIVSYTGKTATFTPANVLSPATSYTASVTTGAKSLTGNALAANVVWSFTTGGSPSALAVVNLGTAGNFVLLAKTGISTTGTTSITGDLGISPAAASFITGFGLVADASNVFAISSLVTGKAYAANYASPTPVNLTTAVSNMETAYTNAAGRTLPDYTELGSGDISGLTLFPGLYKWGTGVLINGGVTLSGGVTDVWIFQIAQNLTMGNGAIITLTGGALARNIYWQVAGATSLGTTSHFEGIILSMTGITFKTGASIKGRALAQTAVVLDGNAVVQPE